PTGPGPSEALVTRLLPDGSPDPAFNGGQPVVSLVFGGSSSVPNAVATDAAGNVYLTGAGAGLAGLPVARLTAAGSPDQAFGLNGVVMVGSQIGIGESIKVDPAGRVVLAGFLGPSGQSDFLVARLVSNGMPDPLFN